MKTTRYTPLQIFIHIAAQYPVAKVIFDAFTGGLTANPIQDVEQRTGRAAVTLLLLSLACTPLNTLFGWREPLKRRRTLGLYAFLYATIHMLIFVNLDYGLSLPLILDAVTKKVFIIVGVIAFLLLLPLAITSFDIWKVRLGKNWKRLHRLVYLIAPLTILHFAWARKGDIFRLQGNILQPLIYGLILIGFLVLRVGPIRTWVASLHTRGLFPLKEKKPGSSE
jgi:sulfoxide reductase heme-binding subunit YedZ